MMDEVPPSITRRLSDPTQVTVGRTSIPVPELNKSNEYRCRNGFVLVFSNVHRLYHYITRIYRVEVRRK